MQDLRITLIQSDLAWEDPARNLSLFGKLVQSAGETDIIVLPEMFSTGFSMNAADLAEAPDGSTVQWMHEMAEETMLCGGLGHHGGRRSVFQQTGLDVPRRAL